MHKIVYLWNSLTKDAVVKIVVWVVRRGQTLGEKPSDSCWLDKPQQAEEILRVKNICRMGEYLAGEGERVQNNVFSVPILPWIFAYGNIYELGGTFMRINTAIEDSCWTEN